MNSTLKKVLMAGAACVVVSGSAMAQISRGIEGTGEVPRAFPGTAGAELSDRGTAPEMPEVDVDEIGRDLNLDPEAMRKSFGTVSRSAGGEESREPPSEDVLRSLDGAMNTDPAFDDSDRQVFGSDDRVQVTDSSQFPFRAFGLLQGEYPDGQTYNNCSATLIGPRTLLTAAHCLYSHDKGGWLDKFVFAPGILSMQNIPYDIWDYETAYIFEGYLTNYQGYYGSVVPWDIGLVVLKQPIGEILGYMSYAHDEQLGNFHANLIAYPGDKPAGTMWRATCDVKAENVLPEVFTYDCDTFAGTSGGSVYKYDPATQDRIVLGVNVSENPEYNTAVRINETYYNWIKGLVK